MADPLVKLKSGFVRGLVSKHEDGFNYYSFKGIPYGEPPVGELRFQDPIPIRRWSGILSCKNYNPNAFQSELFFEVNYYNEDSLYLNVFTHLIDNPMANRPVMVYIHEGDFMFGVANDTYCGPGHLIRKNIVLVTIGFRLGVLGFLDLEHESAPGNQGLKDQVLALQWIQQNIRSFGGNPDNVTVFGIGAGSGSAHYLALSPLTKGLMHKVISQGSVVYNPWIAVTNPKEMAVKLCSFLGKELIDSEEIVKFLRSVDTTRLLEAQEKLRRSLDFYPFGPSVDKKSRNPVVPVNRTVAADQGVHLPYLVGYHAKDGLIALLVISRQEFFTLCNEDFEKILMFNGKQILERYKLNINQFKRMYYKNEKVSDENLDVYVQLATDLYFAEGIGKFLRTQVKRSSASTYMYIFNYNSSIALSKFVHKDIPNGAGHLDILPFIFTMDMIDQIGGKNFEKGTREYRLMEQITEMWTNFATYGRPTIQTSELIPVHWKPVSDANMLRYLNLDEDLTMQYIVNPDLKFVCAKDIKA